MTRQPADAKRLTVACPIPREAPVRIRVFLSVVEVLGMDQQPIFLVQVPDARLAHLPFTPKRTMGRHG
jgi:hypothetical protein